MNNAQTANRPTLIESGLDFSRYGYFMRPIPRDEPHVLTTPEAARWFELEDLIAQLIGGDFTAVPAVLECCRQSRDWRIKTVATQILGHAGTIDCYRDMRAELEQDSVRERDVVDVATRERVLLYCGAFAGWARLDVVPVLLDLYLALRSKRTPEIALLPLLMAELLTDDRGTMIAHEPPEEHIEDYFDLVMERYESLAETLGSEKILVYRGALFSVQGLAKGMRHLTTRYVSSELRRLRARFEPATGIDCSAMFEGSTTNALVAAAIAERFLESSDAARFKPGVRYFFGHQIPD